MAKAWRLICYDVRDPKRLYRAAKILEGYGERVQYSIFRCHLSEKEESELRWKLGKVLKQEDDLLVIPLCDACVSRMRVHREESRWPAEPPHHRTL